MDDSAPPPGAPAPRKRDAARRLAWTIAGLLALALGLIGVVLPVLPTTPLVILAAFCFSSGSPRLRRWLLAHRVFGPVIADWEAHGAIPRPIKRLSCAVMALVFAANVWAGVSPWVLVVQAICLSGAATYVLTRPDGPG
ncbi:YbaN family protein [Sedimentitalea arenosa]|uniref:YbaN family protein n=1 Tax=Sedimentitalea arenosa TaxID=2798803 RepID=A0A8J7J9B5_9RHOB|nr:YbaN family protein [Arenibacterium arenosum]MBJ6371393.1 YbaN family protein [Arenibacterium arenosum]